MRRTLSLIGVAVGVEAAGAAGAEEVRRRRHPAGHRIPRREAGGQCPGGDLLFLLFQHFYCMYILISGNVLVS